MNDLDLDLDPNAHPPSGCVTIYAGGLQAGDEISIDGGKTFRRIGRVAHHRNRVTVSFASAARTLFFNDDELVVTRDR